jgi:hypothetical protein
MLLIYSRWCLLDGASSLLSSGPIYPGGLAMQPLGAETTALRIFAGGLTLGEIVPVAIATLGLYIIKKTVQPIEGTNDADVLTPQEKAKIGPLPKPADLKGKTPEEVDKILKEKGLTPEPGPKGVTRYPVPGRTGDQVLVEPGSKFNSDPVKQGPYGRVIENGKRSDPFPLAGNPTLKP